MHTVFGLENMERDDSEDMRSWEDNIIMDLGKIGCEDANWIHLAQDRDKERAVANTVKNLQIP
jgi:hypothetical protein